MAANPKPGVIDRSHPARVELRAMSATHGCIVTHHLDGSVTLTDATCSRNFPGVAVALESLRNPDRMGATPATPCVSRSLASPAPFRTNPPQPATNAAERK
jgi:hypothetical protein